MAKKIMTCKAAPEIELQFDGGEAILLRFDIRCLSSIQELEGGLKDFLKRGIPEMAAVIIYAAGKDCESHQHYEYPLTHLSTPVAIHSYE